MKCKDCGIEILDRSKDLWTRKFLDSGLCLDCFRIMESEEDPESTKYLDIKKLKSERNKRRVENGWRK